MMVRGASSEFSKHVIYPSRPKVHSGVGNHIHIHVRVYVSYGVKVEVAACPRQPALHWPAELHELESSTTTTTTLCAHLPPASTSNIITRASAKSDYINIRLLRQHIELVA